MANNIPPNSSRKYTPEELTPNNLTNSIVMDEGGNKFHIRTADLTYPTNAGDNEYPHYMGFFINMRGKSKFLTDKNAKEINYAAENRFDRKKLNEMLNGGTAILGGLVGGNVGMSIAGTVLANKSKSSAYAKWIGLAAGGIAGGVAGYALADQAASYFEYDKAYRLSSVITLAVNEKPSVQYQVDYSTQDMGTLGGIIAGGTSAIDSTLTSGANEIGRAALLNLAAIPGGIASAFGSDFDYKALASVGTGTALNPFREQVFQNVSARSFQFDYKFLPRSELESKAVETIINEFKFHMHPELSAGGLFYIYPSEFNIVYYFKDKKNTHMHRISTCVLQNMQVDYGGQQFASFNNGAPSEINMRLQFVELEVLTKERIKKGF